MKSMKKHNAFMASIPSKRNDPYAAAAAEVDSPGFLLTTVERLAGLAQARSMWPVTMGLACCAIEMMAAGTPRFDMARFGWEVFRASPRHADVMIVSGRVSHKMAPIVRNVYDSMPEPKWVISMGPAHPREASSTTTPSSRAATTSSRWTSTCRAARRAPRCSSTPCSS